MNKKVLAISLAVCILVGLGAGFTLAYLKDDDSVVNTFTVGNVQIALTEPSWDSRDDDEGGYEIEVENVYPGERLAKDPTVTNNGTNPALIRVKVDIPTFGNGTPYATVEGVHDDWYLHTDGYYYYMKPLNAGQTAPAVFTHVRFSTAITNDVPGNNIVVTAYAVQAQGVFPSYSAYDDGIDVGMLAKIAPFFNNAFQNNPTT